MIICWKSIFKTSKKITHLFHVIFKNIQLNGIIMEMNETLTTWFHVQERIWIDYIKEKSNACYRPMIIFYTQSKQNICTVVIDVPLSEMMNFISKKLKESNQGNFIKDDKIIGVMTYFYLFTPTNEIESILNFHLFSPRQNGLTDFARYYVIDSSRSSSKQKVVFNVDKINNEITLKELEDANKSSNSWKNPFFMV